MKEAIAGDLEGESFIYDMFKYELANHEYGCTWELEDTIQALNLTLEEINNSQNLKAGLKKAIATFR